MAQEKDSISEPLQKSAQAANTVRGAIKTGKAIADAAKGAAIGGPYGAVAGLVWENRKLIGKVILAVIAVLMIPILFICMLPSLIFGGLKSAFSPSDPDTPILNSSTAVSTNIANISASISTILSERLTELYAEIDTDFASSGADQKELLGDSSPNFQANQFIAQYCAFRNQNYESVSLYDMENILRQNKDKLYSYTKKVEERTVSTTKTVTDPITGREVEITTTNIEKWVVYTAFYNGENYFADNIFHLSDEQKELAKNYAENLTLFLNTT